MIRVNRAAVPMPEVLRRGVGSPADREYEKALIFYQDYKNNRQRGGFPFKVYKHETVKSALNDLFHQKCAYCESQLGVTAPLDIEQFRPKSGLISDRGEHLPLHYWWLCNEWSNLYTSCADCNRVSSQRMFTSLQPNAEVIRSGKGGRFPLQNEGSRAPLLAGPELLAKESRLLLDPCEDDVERMLIYSEDGIVSSTDPRGLTTIEILGLNRLGLVRERRRTADMFSLLFESLAHSPDESRRSELLERIREHMSDSATYAGMCRQLFNSMRESPREFKARSVLDQLPETSPAIMTKADKERGKKALAEFRAVQETYSLEDEGPDATAAYLRARDRRVERISLRNIRSIADLDLKVTDQGGQAPWLMLLGENAAGKSTVIHSLALALVGDRYRERLIADLELDPSRMVRTGTEFGEIRVWLSGATEPRVLRIHVNGKVETSGRDGQLMLLAYGSTRLLPRRHPSERSNPAYARIENLFDPFVPLVDAEKWLLELPPHEFDYAAIAIKKSLSIGFERELVRQDGAVGLLERGNLTPLSMLCDGYQTVIALIADILSVVLPTWKTPDLAQGLVLIDEVGNHLHPSWKLRFVESMRDILPAMQVCATTHEPLCLRGLRQGEIAVLRKGPRGGISLVADLPSIEGLRIDQILTSEHFGLSSTLDPEMQERFDRYYELLRNPSPTPQDEKEMSELRTEINRVQQLGNTERERRMLDAIDRFLAERPEMESEQRVAGSEAALDADLAAIWREAAARGAPTA